VARPTFEHLYRESDMPRRVYSFDPPDRFVAGAVGQPGQRTFFLQASKGAQIVSVALEKAQVAVLAERVATLLLALRQRGVEIGEEQLTGSVTPELEEPVVEEFRVGTLTLGWDADREVVVIEAREMGEADLEEEDEEEDAAAEADESEEDVAEALRAAIARLAEVPDAPTDANLDLVRVQLEPDAALQFASGAIAVVQAGRPPCPMCGEPLEPTGHFCARRNGYTH
jgi:uncharacterized repeat protein (TIGR03847 family)